jgi:hypothetical protein
MIWVRCENPRWVLRRRPHVRYLEVNRTSWVHRGIDANAPSATWTSFIAQAKARSNDVIVVALSYMGVVSLIDRPRNADFEFAS